METNITILVAFKFQNFTSKSFEREILSSTSFSQLIMTILREFDISSFDPTYFDVTLKSHNNSKVNITDRISSYQDQNSIPIIFLTIKGEETAELQATIDNKKHFFDIPLTKDTACREAIGLCNLLYGIASPRSQYQLIEKDQEGRVVKRCLPSERLQFVIKRNQFNLLYINKKRTAKSPGRSLTYTGLKDFVKEYRASPDRENSPADKSLISSQENLLPIHYNSMPRTSRDKKSHPSRADFPENHDSRSRSSRRQEFEDLPPPRRVRNSSLDPSMQRDSSRMRDEQYLHHDPRDYSDNRMKSKRSEAEIEASLDDTNSRRNRRKLPEVPVSVKAPPESSETLSTLHQILNGGDTRSRSDRFRSDNIPYSDRNPSGNKGRKIDTESSHNQRHRPPQDNPHPGDEENSSQREAAVSSSSRWKTSPHTSRKFEGGGNTPRVNHQSRTRHDSDNSDIDSPQLHRRAPAPNDQHSDPSKLWKNRSEEIVRRTNDDKVQDTSRSVRSSSRQDFSSRKDHHSSRNSLNNNRYLESPGATKRFYPDVIVQSAANKNEKLVQRDTRGHHPRAGSSASNEIRIFNRDSPRTAPSSRPYENRSKSSADFMESQYSHRYQSNRPDSSRTQSRHYETDTRGRGPEYKELRRDDIPSSQTNRRGAPHRSKNESHRGGSDRHQLEEKSSSQAEYSSNGYPTNYEDVQNTSDTNSTLEGTTSSLKRWASQNSVPESRDVNDKRLAKQEFLKKRSSARSAQRDIPDPQSAVSLSTSGYISAHPSLSSVSSDLTSYSMTHKVTQTETDATSAVQPVAKIRRNKDYPSLFELLSVCQLYRVVINRTSKWDSLGIHCFEAQLEEETNEDMSSGTPLNDSLSPGGRRILIGKRVEVTAFQQVNPERMQQIKSVVCMDIVTGDNSAAARNGHLRTGDIFVEINGIPVLPYAPQQIDNLLKSYSDLELTIARYHKTHAASRRFSLDHSAILPPDPDQITNPGDTKEAINNDQALKEKYLRVKQMSHAKDRIISQLKEMVCKKVEIKKLSSENNHRNQTAANNTFQAI